MGKKKETGFWIRCLVIKIKTFKGGGRSFFIRDLNTDHRCWVPVSFLLNSHELPGREYMFFISDEHRSRDELWALQSEEVRDLLEKARDLQSNLRVARAG